VELFINQIHNELRRKTENCCVNLFCLRYGQNYIASLFSSCPKSGWPRQSEGEAGLLTRPSDYVFKDFSATGRLLTAEL